MKKQKYKLKKSVYSLIAIIFVIIGLAIFFWYFNTREVYDENNLPTKFVSYEFVSSRTEAKLYYPGSREYHRFGHSYKQGGYAAAGAVLISIDSPEKIYAWYRQWLISNGWRYEEYAFGGLGTSQESLQGYIRGDREKFYIAINKPENLSRTLGQKVPKDATIFEIRYFINPKNNLFIFPTPTKAQISLGKLR